MLKMLQELAEDEDEDLAPSKSFEQTRSPSIILSMGNSNLLAEEKLRST
jgi:hypothetical protein